MRKFFFVMSIGISLGISSCGGDKKAADAGPPPSATMAPSAPADPGKALFMANCAACHAVLKDMTGPALKGVTGRWGCDTAKLVTYVHNSQKMIQAEGESSYIGKVFVKYGRTVMPPFTLTDDEIKQVLRYIEAQSAP